MVPRPHLPWIPPRRRGCAVCAGGRKGESSKSSSSSERRKSDCPSSSRSSASFSSSVLNTLGRGTQTSSCSPHDKAAMVGSSTGMDTCEVAAGTGLGDVRGSWPDRCSQEPGFSIAIWACFSPRHAEQTWCVSLHEILFPHEQSRTASPSLAGTVCIAAAIVVLDNPCNRLECKIEGVWRKTAWWPVVRPRVC